MDFVSHVKNSKDLETSYVETRAGFVAIALEKGRRATPYVEEARILANRVAQITNPCDLPNIDAIYNGLVAAAGLSDKAAKHLGKDNCKNAIDEFIENFLIPAGEKFGEELVYRFLLTRGDSLGGSMRNVVGTLAQRKLNTSITSSLIMSGREFHWLQSPSNKWIPYNERADKITFEDAKGLSWINDKNLSRSIIYNLKVPIVGNNVDVVLFNKDYMQLSDNWKNEINNPASYVALGELKGGIDPAGADEHWKTAKSALERIYKSFYLLNVAPHIFFIGAAIEAKMATEIFSELKEGRLAYAANLTKPNHITALCQWLTVL